MLIEERQWQTPAQSFRDGGWLYLGLPGLGISQTDRTSYATGKSKLGPGWGLQKLQAQAQMWKRHLLPQCDAGRAGDWQPGAMSVGTLPGPVPGKGFQSRARHWDCAMCGTSSPTLPSLPNHATHRQTLQGPVGFSMWTKGSQSAVSHSSLFPSSCTVGTPPGLGYIPEPLWPTRGCFHSLELKPELRKEQWAESGFIYRATRSDP